jgi:hypothetical protein
MGDRDVGRMGESEFRQWCAQCGLVPNPPSEDAGGWDFIVQFKTPPSSKAVLALDQMEFPTVFWVQVKSTDTRDAPDISLSNWRKLVDPALPAFVLLMNFGGGERPVEANLVHVDGDLITKVLRRLRKLDPADAGVLHKRTLSVAWDQTHALHELNGASLRKAIERALGPSPKRYWETKKRWYEEAGYSGARYRMQFTTGSAAEQDALDRLVDVALGLSKELPSTLTGFEEIRFGIPAPTHSLGDLPRDVTLGFPALPHLPGVLELSGSDGTKRVRVPCSVYHPWNLFPFIPSDRLRYRIATRDVSFVLGFRGATAAYVGSVSASEIEWSQERSLEEWDQTYRLVQMIDDTSLELKMELNIQSTRVNGTIKPGRRLNLEERDREIAQACLNAVAVARTLNIGLDHSLSPHDLYLQRELLAEAAGVLTTDPSMISITGEVGGEAPQGHRVGYPVVVAAPLGGLLVVAGVALIGAIDCGPECPGRKPFRLTNPERRLLFVETVHMEPGETYSADEYRKRSSDAILAQGLDLLPGTDSDA